MYHLHKISSSRGLILPTLEYLVGWGNPNEGLAGAVVGLTVLLTFSLLIYIFHLASQVSNSHCLSVCVSTFHKLDFHILFYSYL